MENRTLSETFTGTSIINSTVGEGDQMSRSEYIFFIAVRGVLNFIIQIVVTFLNISTIIVIFRNKTLQISSNALVVCFSIGHSFAGIVGILTLVCDHFVLTFAETWKLCCKTYIFLEGFQHVINYTSTMTISIERFYSIKFPLHAFQYNSFGRMFKVSIVILVISFLIILTMTLIGTFTGDVIYSPTACTTHYVFGQEGTFVYVAIFIVSSLIGLAMTGLIISLLIHRQWRQKINETIHHNTEYKITKMLCTGKRHWEKWELFCQRWQTAFLQTSKFRKGTTGWTELLDKIELYLRDFFSLYSGTNSWNCYQSIKINLSQLLGVFWDSISNAYLSTLGLLCKNFRKCDKGYQSRFYEMGSLLFSLVSF